MTERSDAGRQAMFVVEGGSLAGRAVAVPVPIGGTGSRGHWLVVARRSGSAGDLERLIARQAAMVVALELMRERAVARPSGGSPGTSSPRPSAATSAPTSCAGGCTRSASTAASPSSSSTSKAPRTTPRSSPRRCAAPGWRRSSPSTDRRAGRCSARSSIPTTAIRSKARPRGLAALGEGRKIRAAVSRPAQVGGMRKAFHEARCTLEATALANGNAPDVASHRDLGAFTLRSTAAPG